jgi:hypothetical protein
VVAALANLLVTLVLLTPDGQGGSVHGPKDVVVAPNRIVCASPRCSDAWFHVDSFTSAVGSANSERVRAVSGKLLAIASMCNVFAVIAVYTKYGLLIQLYTLGKERTRLDGSPECMVMRSVFTGRSSECVQR